MHQCSPRFIAIATNFQYEFRLVVTLFGRGKIVKGRLKKKGVRAFSDRSNYPECTSLVASVLSEPAEQYVTKL